MGPSRFAGTCFRTGVDSATEAGGGPGGTEGVPGEDAGFEALVEETEAGEGPGGTEGVDPPVQAQAATEAACAALKELPS